MNARNKTFVKLGIGTLHNNCNLDTNYFTYSIGYNVRNIVHNALRLYYAKIINSITL